MTRGQTTAQGPVGIGIVGTGMVAGTHVAALAGLTDQARIIGVTARDPGRRAAFAAAHNVAAAPSVDALLADPAVEVLLVLTPPDTHLALVRQAAAAGCDVLLEKPLAASLADACAIAAEAEASGIRVGLCFQNRYRAGAAAAIRLVDEGRLGALIGGQVQIPLWRPQSYYDEPGRGTLSRDGGGVLLTQGIHSLDLLIRLAGWPVRVTARAGTSPVHRMETEDWASALIEFPDGGCVTLWATTCARPGHPEQLDLTGSSGSLRLTGPRLDATFADGTTIEADDPASRGGTGASPMSFGHRPHQGLIADYLAAVRAETTPPVGARDGLRAQLLIDCILGSASRRQPLDVPPSP